MPPITLPIAEYAPDQPALSGKASANILNVYPRTDKSYGPILSPSPITALGALGSRCLGGTAFISSTGAVNTFAGTQTDLYYLVNTASAWSNVSKSAGTYNCALTDLWQFVSFNGDVIAANVNDATQYYTPGTSTNFANLPGNPPKMRYMATIKNAFVMGGYVVDPTTGNTLTQRIQWCDSGNARSWSTPGSVAAAQTQAGAGDLLGPYGEITGVVGDLTNADGAVFQRLSVRRLMYVGPPLIFDVLPVENVTGTNAPYSIVQYGGVVYYLAQDGFRSFDGNQSQLIGFNRVDKTFMSLLDGGYVNRVVGAADLFTRSVWWAFPGPQNSNGNPNYIIIYNIPLNRWTLAQITCEVLLRLISLGYTLDQLWTVLGYTLDGLPAPLDSSLWAGGVVQMGLFDTSHMLNFLTGDALAATVETEEIQPIPGRRAFIGREGARPRIDGATPTPSVSIGHRERIQDTVTYSQAAALNSMGICPARTSGRLLRAKMTIPAGSGGNANWSHISGIELDVIPQGTR